MLSGDTIRIKVHFKTFTGDSVDPTEISLKIYDKDKNLIEEIPINDTNKITEGVYFYDYFPAPEMTDYFYFEFIGQHNNLPILARDKVEIRFI